MDDGRAPSDAAVIAEQANAGTTDCILRVLAGLSLIALTLSGSIGPWGYLGVVLLATGLTGLNTCPSK
jgi:hypothetical protein